MSYCVRVVGAIFVGASMAMGTACVGSSPELIGPAYGDGFWAHWGDGQAELAGYELKFDRYGEVRQGTAVAIFVTETFSESLRVKADAGKHPASDEYPVIKLNMVQDFPTGVYDYNMMTSAFVTLAPRHERPAGSATKVSFSAQEWCGHAYQQVLFYDDKVAQQSHSYFDGEADHQSSLSYPADGVAEDTLLLWARGLASPAVEAGQSVKVKLLMSLATARLNHRKIGWRDAVLSRGVQIEQVTVPAGTFAARTLSAAIEGGGTWTFLVEDAAPHRVLEWRHTDGQSGRLVGVDRMRYWKMNANRFAAAVERLGLKPRTARTP